MAFEFVRRADGLVMCRLDPQEKTIIAQVAQEVADLIRMDLGLDTRAPAVEEAAGSEDPLTRLEAEMATVEREPSDSAVRRLFPAASEDPVRARELRRLGQQTLAESKLRSLRTVMSTIDSGGPLRAEIVLSSQDAQAWLTALTDLRLVLADRLSVREDEDIETLRMLQQIQADAGIDPEALDGGTGAPDGTAQVRPMSDEDGASVAGPELVLAVYDLLTWLQDSLVRVQMSALDDEGDQ